MTVFVLDKRHNPLMPCTEKRARLLLKRGRARVHRMHPFTIRLVDRLAENSVVQPVRIKIDPGSVVTGLAVVREEDTASKEGPSQAVLSLIEISHRGKTISKRLLARRGHRRFRRSRLRYRAPRFDNRTRPPGWLPPSLQHRVDTTMSWVRRLRKLVPVTALSVERVRFDTQLMQDPEISGIGYQNGSLVGTEVREYLLEKWQRTCAYCDAKNTPLEIDHIVCKSSGGSDRVSNLTLACHACNQRKDRLPVETFVRDKQRLRLILAQAKAPLRDAAVMNATRWALWRALCGTGLPIEASSGGRTKWNRKRFGIPKTHALDAACVGACAGVNGWRRPTLAIKATGRGVYQRTRLTACGFPNGYLMRRKRVHGFATGDMVRACVPDGKKAGDYVGRVAIRSNGSFNIATDERVVQGISWRHCVLVQRADGYGYGIVTRKGCAPSGPEEPGFRASVRG